jgi:hypothetical protein
MIVVSTRLTVRIADFYFAEGECPIPVDIRRFVQLSVPREGVRCNPFHTIIIDLRQNPKLLLSRMKRDTRYEIRRATEREGLLYEYWQNCNPEVIAQFADFYNRFASQIRRRKLARMRFDVLARHGLLDISRISSPDGKALVWHSHYRGNDRARLLESASIYHGASDSVYRTYLGRANRYHHWRDMLRFKELGCRIYDLGGWHAGTEDARKLRINAFKEEFGGTLVQNFNCTEALTLKGRVATTLLSLLRR